MPDLTTRPKDDDGDSYSPEKIRWVEIANIVRLRLESRLIAITEMTPDEMLSYTKALREAMALEIGAIGFDAEIKHRNEEHWQ